MRRTMVRSGSAVLVAALTVLLGTSCAGTDATRSTVDVSVGAMPNEDVVALPKDVETAVTDAIGRLPDLVREALAASGVPGAAVAVVRGGKTVFAEGFGERRQGEAARVGPDTVFQLASVSKSLAATAVAKAVGDRKVEWNTPIASLLPSFALADAQTTRMLTVADLFSHRSGLPTGAGDDLEDIGYDRAYILEQLRRVPLDAFRSSYHYSNFGLTAGAEAVATALRKPWEDVMDELVFGPLGMTTASARHADFTARPDRASLHAWVDGRFEPRFDAIRTPRHRRAASRPVCGTSRGGRRSCSRAAASTVSRTSTRMRCSRRRRRRWSPGMRRPRRSGRATTATGSMSPRSPAAASR